MSEFLTLFQRADAHFASGRYAEASARSRSRSASLASAFAKRASPSVVRDRGARLIYNPARGTA